MKKSCILLYFLFSCFSSFSQENLRFKKNAFSLNAPAFTRIYSVNYERVLKQKKWIFISNLGIYYLPISDGTKRLSAFFIGTDFLQGKKTHYLDLGMSLMFDKEADFRGSSDKRYLGVSFIPKIGYRHQKKAKGIFYRALVMPFLLDITPRSRSNQEDNKYFSFRSPSIDLASFSIGYSF